MPRVRFLRDFPWHVPGTGTSQTIAYRAGTEDLVTTPCAVAAVAAAERVAEPKRKRTRDAKAD